MIKYDKKLYGVISNMSIAIERRDFLQKFDCFICISRKQESFSLTITVKKRRLRWKKILAGCLEKANIDSMVITMERRTELFTRNEVERAASALPERFRSGIPPEPVIPSVPASSAA